jgi:hypothetical protein
MCGSRLFLALASLLAVGEEEEEGGAKLVDARSLLTAAQLAD